MCRSRRVLPSAAWDRLHTALPLNRVLGLPLNRVLDLPLSRVLGLPLNRVLALPPDDFIK